MFQFDQQLMIRLHDSERRMTDIGSLDFFWERITTLVYPVLITMLCSADMNFFLETSGHKSVTGSTEGYALLDHGHKILWWQKDASAAEK